jgi:hypothetical protein
MLKIAGIFFYICSFSLLAQQCSPISKNLIIQQDNKLVLDKKTGLIWRRCSQGLNLVDGQCIGTIKKYSFFKAKRIAESAHYSNFDDWRIPTIKELVSITELACFSPAINAFIFPNTDTSTYYWSSSPYVANTDNAWVLDFDYGGENHFDRKLKYPVRLVRTGQ